jgi:predicted thioesterase
MITPYQASQIAQAMASITMITLEPAYRAEFKAKGAHVRARAGRGAKTYHQKDGAQHMLTFGPRMVSDKVDGDSSRWLSAREIKRYRYYDGDQTVTSLLAHTILHEFAHALQTLAGERLRGSVHNAAFYRILSDLHSTHGGVVRDTLRETLKRMGLDLDNQRAAATTSNTNEVARSQSTYDFRVGGPVRVEHNGRVIIGRVVRVNQKTLSVDGTENGFPSSVRATPDLVSKLTEGEYLQALGDHAKARESTGITTLIETPPPKAPAFSIGDKVTFAFKGRNVEGRVVRINQKTVSVDSGNGGGYRVHPSLLRLAA